LSLRLGVPRPGKREVDLLVIGGGPAGLNAALYGRRYMLETLVVAESIGGQVAVADVIENYLGIHSIRGIELADRFRRHVEAAGASIVIDRVVGIERDDSGVFRARTLKGLEVVAKSIVVAIGAKRRRLGVPGESELAGRGISYCAVCDAPLYQGSENVVVVGGGNSAMKGALLLSQYAKRVTLVHRGESFRAQPLLVESVRKHGNVEFVLGSVVTEIIGDKRVRAVKVKNLKTGEERVIEADGVFVEIGYEPDVEFARMLGVEIDSEGYIVVNELMETSRPGIFAAGNCTNKWKELRQIITAAAQGAIAAFSAYNYIKRAFGVERG